MQRVDEIAQLARDTAGPTSRATEIDDAAIAFRQPADLGNLPALAASTNGVAEQMHHGTTATYVKAHLHEVASALGVLTREPHPLAPAYQPATTTSAH